ncbi:4-(cytidine 5'-diphospho)-2-C-methyl-D-erythritol kinase [Propioniciclava soli]|uniref:4-diphosphocytidyl-2-C-methyl-D-erythritol kinase n=1 Tax=Propioniciclava soli TaxID=2775081 RepID=A0ABZ3CAM6_9ACTN|nr:4-(cytidine 5'-diphospho)-2-C-methyl-D-erythritol kinase [Propioniciclava soli]
MTPLSTLAPGSGWVKVRASGKVNLALRVGAPREDGYHPLATVFQALSLFDDLGVRAAAPGHYSVRVAGAQADRVPTDASNLAVRAARLLAEHHGGAQERGVEIVIRKTIPVTGGMAGGSANAAAALVACAELWGIDVSPDELAGLGAQLGADVPFSLRGSTALGTGRGDELVPVLSRGSYHWVLALPEFELSTPAVFRRFDALFPGAPAAPPPVPEALLEGLACGDPARVAEHLVNDLQPAALDLQPALGDLLDAGLERGALAGIVSGSGPTCAFLAPHEDAAVRLSVALGGLGLCREVRRASGPAPGARLQAG